jgi:hypothetical protein
MQLFFFFFSNFQTSQVQRDAPAENSPVDTDRNARAMTDEDDDFSSDFDDLIRYFQVSSFNNIVLSLLPVYGRFQEHTIKV